MILVEEEYLKFCTLAREASSPRVEHHQLINDKDSYRDNLVIKPVQIAYNNRVLSNDEDQNVQGNKVRTLEIV